MSYFAQWPYPPNSFVTNEFFDSHIYGLPEHIVLNTSKIVRRLQSVFATDVDYILSRLIEAVSDKQMHAIVLRKTVQDLYNGMYESGRYNQIQLLDILSTLEMASCDLKDYLTENKLYLKGRFLPYKYETTMTDGSIVVVRVHNFEDWCDSVGLMEMTDL